VLASWRRRRYNDLVSSIGQCEHSTVPGPSGSEYQIQVEVHWNDQPGGHLRVLGAVDDGGLRALNPITHDFLVAPEKAT
jgi:hypothetical protein